VQKSAASKHAADEEFTLERTRTTTTEKITAKSRSLSSRRDTRDDGAVQVRQCYDAVL